MVSANGNKQEIKYLIALLLQTGSVALRQQTVRVIVMFMDMG